MKAKAGAFAYPVSIVDFAGKPVVAGLQMEGSRLRLPEASQTPQGAASSAPPSSNRREVLQQNLLLICLGFRVE